MSKQTLEPDFVLFLEKKDNWQTLYYQIFIEPKGGHLLKQDEWKEKFLRSLKDDASAIILWQTRKYIIWGMPFYNEQLRKTEFEKEIDKLVQ